MASGRDAITANNNAPSDDHGDLDALFESIDTRTTMVTGTSRLARHLTDRYNDWQRRLDNDVWDTPDVVPWQVFVDRAWHEWVARDPHNPAAAKILLRPSQEQALWERVIEDSLPEEKAHLYQIPATARAAASAYRLSTSWGLEDDGDTPLLSQDVRQFRVWSIAFAKHCEEANFLSLADAANLLVAWTNDNAPKNLERLVLCGFDQLTPDQTAMIKALRSQDVTVDLLAPAGEVADAHRISFTTPADESLGAARWARQVLEKNPDARVGIIVTDLEAVRTRIGRDLSNVLDSGNIEPHGTGRSSLFHLSLGAPLADAPIVFAALTALELIDDPVDVNLTGVILRSPFFAGFETERDGRAHLDIAMRRAGQERTTLANIHWLASENPGTADLAPEFAGTLRKLRAERESLELNRGTRKTATQWAEIFTRWLATLGWGSGREIDSEEFQAREAWNALVSDFCSLDLVIGPLSLAGATAQLARLAQERVHQARARPSPVEVMGVIESGGLNFTHLWLLGMTDDVWPAPARPSPFVPVVSQRAAGIAQSDAASSLAHARDVTQRLLASASVVMVSHASADADTPMRLSPLFAHLPQASLDDIVSDQSVERIEQLNAMNTRLETISDSQAPALEGKVAGGTQIFSNQSKCPFKAYAIHRLGARSPGSLSAGLDALERGNLVHDVMDLLWQEIRDSQTLASLDDAARARVAREAVETGIEGRARMDRLKYTDAIVEIEKTRLTDIVIEWLEDEGQRPPFTVEFVEDEQVREIAGVEVSLRMDRVDKLANGKRLIIDYKTGVVSVNDWLDARPKDPQLLVYAAALGVDTVDGIAFARLKKGQSEFVGLAEDDAGFGKVKPVSGASKRVKDQGYSDLSEMLSVTESIVANLGRDFSAGEAIVDPLPNACSWCDLKPLCRISQADIDDLQESDDVAG